MTTAVIEETESLKGIICAPPSKSYTHRSIIAASLSNGVSCIRLPLFSDDIEATIAACESFGASIKQRITELHIKGTSAPTAPSTEINCRDSASTMRFLIPIAALAQGKTVLDGSTSLRKRPIGPLVKSLQKLGVECSSNKGFPPITVFGKSIRGGKTSLVGDVSSQFVTGLLFACPLAEHNTEITISTPLESKPYVKLTMDILQSHKIQVSASREFRIFRIPHNQSYVPRNHIVPGDFSAAAFLLTAAAITNSEITIKNLFQNQPDSKIVDILKKVGATVRIINHSVRVSYNKLKGTIIDARDIPDLIPICTTLACVADGVTQIFGAKRLRIKESDRLNAISSELQKMGANIVEKKDGLVINGPNKLEGTRINPHGDHRIAMACAIAGLKAKGKTEILEAECINKSYPNFFEDLKQLGAKIDVG